MLDQLPMEMILAISNHLDPLSVAKLSQTSGRLNGTLQRPLARAAKQYALPDEAEYKQRIIFDEEGKGTRSLKRTYSLPPQRLVHAICHHQFNKVKNFLEAGVDPNAYDLDGQRMLSLAIRVAKDEPIMDLLLEHGANPALNDVCWPYTSPVVDATSMGNEVVKKLISIGADYTDARVIHALAGRCSLEVIKLAIDKGADCRLLSQNHRTVIHHAAINADHPDVLGFLVEKYPDLLTPQVVRTAVWLTIYKGSAELIKTLIAAGIDITRDTTLHAALANRCSLDVIKLAIDKGADFGQISFDGKTMIHHAATNINHPDVLGFLIQRYPELLSPQTVRTALWLTIYKGSAELVKILLAASLINITEDANLHAALASRCSLDVIRLAIYKGADFRRINPDGKTMIHYAAMNTEHPDVLRLLIAIYPELLSSQTASGKTALWSALYEGSAELASILITAGIDIDARDATGKTALHAALEFSEQANNQTTESASREIVERSLSIATALLEHGIQVGIPDQWGMTELHHAVRQNSGHWLHQGMPSIVRLLLSRRTVDVNALGPGGLTPLHLAARAGWLKVVRILVEEGDADVNEIDNHGVTPADLAWEFPDVFAYLSQIAIISLGGQLTGSRACGWA
jgi:ankyrin repeat protein